MTETTHKTETIPYGFWAGGLLHDVREQPYRDKESNQLSSFWVATLNVPDQVYIRLVLPTPEALRGVPRDRKLLLNIAGWPKDGTIRWRYLGEHPWMDAPEIADPATGEMKAFNGLAIIGTYIATRSRLVRDYDKPSPNAKKLEHRFKVNMATRENPDYPEILLEHDHEPNAYLKDATVLVPIQDPYASKRGVIYRAAPGRMPIVLDQ